MIYFAVSGPPPLDSAKSALAVRGKISLKVVSLGKLKLFWF